MRSQGDEGLRRKGGCRYYMGKTMGDDDVNVTIAYYDLLEIINNLL